MTSASTVKSFVTTVLPGAVTPQLAEVLADDV
jgi:hypothetical protein